MKQLFLILISFIFGYFYLYISKLNNFKMLITTVIHTILYIYIIYLLNDGTINYILKISLILGYLLNNKCKILPKKRKVKN